MEKQKNILDRVSLPTRIIVNRVQLTAATLADILSKGEFAPGGGDTCELEAGGQVLARGKIVRKRGRYFFKVVTTAEEERT
jgi:hypothetical protein